MRTAWFLIAALAAYAQQPAYEIRGVVLDRATNQGVRTSVFVADLEREVPTNASGEFRFEAKGPGSFTVASSSDQYISAFETVVLTESNRQGQVRLLLDRRGEMTGRVVDDESGKPLSDVALLAMQVVWAKGVRQPAMGLDVATAGDGTFHALGITRAPWVAAVWPRLWSTGPARRTDIPAEEFQATDQDYAPSYWPGGARTLHGTLPAPFAAGQATDLGTIRVRKMTYRRALVHVPPEHCGTTQLYRGMLWRDGQTEPDYAIDVQCGRDILLKGLIPGEQYRLEIYAKKSAQDELRTASVRFAVGDRNPELTAILKRGADLEGSVRIAEGSSLKPEAVRLTLRHGLAEPQEVKADANGRFRFVNVPSREVTLSVSDVLQRARFNGKELVGNGFEWSGEGALEVTVDDQGAAVGGTVAQDNKPVPLANVVAVRWPVSAADMFKVLGRVAADAEGRYQFLRLPAGEYRVLAVPVTSKEILEEPSVLERLLSRAEKVTLTRGGAATLNLRPLAVR